MMDFEEQFPSLKEKRVIAPEYLDADCIDTKDVKKHCLDKQRVKEAMNKFEEQTKLWACNNEVKYTLGWLKQELGLEAENGNKRE